ncbi:MAG: DUF1847 domain-containing protein [Parasporobacterium sp.]|nr:DUF1847 domain-containing protein [Parasporobacterium sp.]
MEEKNLSCVDCGRCNCHLGGDFTDFCPTGNMDPDFLKLVIEKYNEDDNLNFMQTAAGVEFDGYCKLTRVEEICLFAKRMGFKKIGVATCVGLIRESRTLAKVLRSHGFEVYGIGCKVGSVSKQLLGIPEKCNEIGGNICNPIMQAELLNKAETEFNIVVGLCVGHDSLFYKYSKAPVTTLVAKDRVTCHNPAAVLYNADSFYARKIWGENK